MIQRKFTFAQKQGNAFTPGVAVGDNSRNNAESRSRNMPKHLRSDEVRNGAHTHSTRTTSASTAPQKLQARNALFNLQRRVGNAAVAQLLGDNGVHVQRAPNEFTIERGVMTGASKTLKGDDETVYYEWNWQVVFNGQAYLYNDWVNANDPALEPSLRETVRERLESGEGIANLQGVM